MIADYVSLALGLYGIRDLALSRRIIRRYRELRASNDARQVLAYLYTLLALGRARICIESQCCGTPVQFYKGITLMYDVRCVTDCQAMVKCYDEPCKKDITLEILTLVDKVKASSPIFVVDFSLFELHHEDEVNELFKQLVVTINTIRMYLSDEYLVFVGIPRELKVKLDLVVPNNVRTYMSYVDLVNLLCARHVVVLDPYADKELEDHEVQRFDVFIVGALVDDKYPRPYATAFLRQCYEVLGLSPESRAIKLWGSTVGVPNRINRVIEIVLRARFNGEPMHEAVINCMSRADKIVRIMHEIQKKFKRIGVAPRQSIEMLCRKLKLEFEVCEKEVLPKLKDIKIVE